MRRSKACFRGRLGQHANAGAMAESRLYANFYANAVRIGSFPCALSPSFQILTARRAPRPFTKRHTPARESPPSGSSLQPEIPLDSGRSDLMSDAVADRADPRKRFGEDRSLLPTLLGGRTFAVEARASFSCGIRGFRVQVELRVTCVKHQPEPFRQPSTGTLQEYQLNRRSRLQRPCPEPLVTSAVRSAGRPRPGELSVAADVRGRLSPGCGRRRRSRGR